MSLPKYLTTVTTFSKILAMILFILLPIVGFELGKSYQKNLTVAPIVQQLGLNDIISPIPTDTVDPRVVEIMDQFLTKKQIISDLDKNLLSGSYSTISDTDLQIKIPTSYVLQERKRESNNIFGHVLFYSKEALLSSTDPEFQIIPNFFIGTISTSLTPQEWLVENVSYQGQKWNKSMKTGKEININGLNMFSVGVACCAGYNQAYIYPYKLLNGQYSLIIFGSYDVFADSDYDTENWTNGIHTERNVILDRVVSTLIVQ